MALAQEGGKLLMDYLDHLLARGDALQHLAAHGPLLDPVDQFPCDTEVDVGLQEGQADLAERLVHVPFGEAAAVAQAVEDRGELIGQGIEHASIVAQSGRSVRVVAPC